MLESMGHESSAVGVALIYQSLVDAIVIDSSDKELAWRIGALGLQTLVTDTIMKSETDRTRLGREILQFGGSMRSKVVVS